MKKAFQYMFLDNKFYKKAFLLLILVILLMYCYLFLPSSRQIPLKFFNYAIIILITLLGCSIIEGYKISIIKSLDIEKENLSILPVLNLKKDFLIGIKYLISLLIFSLPFICIIGAFSFVIGFAPMLAMPHSLIKVSFILFVLSILVYVIYLNCFLPASIAVFVKTNSILSFYKFEEIFKLVSIDKKEYIKSAFVYFILGIFINWCYRICSILSKQSLILSLLTLLILACFVTYINFVMSYIVANINKDI